MSFNPYDIEFNEITTDIAEKKLIVNEIREKIIWYETCDILALETDLSKTKENINRFNVLISKSGNTIKKIKNELTLLDSKLKSKFNPLYYFSADQKAMRKRKNRLLIELETINKNRKKHKSESNALVNHQHQTELIQESYHKFQKEVFVENESTLSNEIEQLEYKLNQISSKKEKVDIQLKPVMEQIDNYKIEIERLKSKLRMAVEYENDLNAARNSYERKLIHEKCESWLGNSKPQKIINDCNRRINQNKRDLEKVEERASTIGSKASRVIKKLIIDGNNLCYSGNVLLGIEPLKRVIDKLSNEYELVLVFDASINEILKMNSVNIESLFSDIKFHIVQGGKQADDIITSIANNPVFDTCIKRKAQKPCIDKGF